MLNINSIANAKSVLRWRFTKYFTGDEKTPAMTELHTQQEVADIKECQERPTDVETLRTLCIEWVKNHIGANFEFREYQLEYIVTILDNILNHKVKINCLEAPTGSGKSWFSFVIAGVAWEYYRKTSYILVSDIGLMNQYNNDIEKFHLNDMGHMKGLANYMCSMNNMIFPSGDCRMHKVSWNILMDDKKCGEKGYHCANECPCVSDRKKAIVSPITVMTYVLYLCFINDVLPLYSSDGSDGVPPFEKRDIVICDEVHKMPDIIQNWCSPTFNKLEDSQNFNVINNYIKDNMLWDNSDEEKKSDTDNLMNLQVTIVNHPSKEGAFQAFKDYCEGQNILLSKVPKIRNLIEASGNHNDGKMTAEEKKVLFVCSWLENRQTHFNVYPKIVDNIGIDKIVINSAYNTKTKKYETDNFTINCVYEEWLVQKYFNEQCNHQVMMSATLGDISLFRREIGVELWTEEEKERKFKFMRIPSTFDFRPSPIYVLPTYRMNFANKDKNMPFVINLIQNILRHHQNQKGIIHTGSYEFSKKLFSGIDASFRNRLLCYSSARDKEYCIKQYGRANNMVLAGPTLVEGLNLPDEECRFMIIMKVPYPSLADQLVKAKNEVIPNWYNGTTIKSVIQSLGRGIRHKNDWCITYIIDGSFCSIYNSTAHNLQPELTQRIQYVSL